MSTNLVKILQDNKEISSEVKVGGDQESIEPVVLDPAACQVALRLVDEDPSRAHKTLRLYLEGKGCDGFTYGVAFDAPTASDLIFSQTGGIQVAVDTQTLPFVQGSTIQWVDDERGKGFLVENPHHRKFRGKFFKRKDWEQKLLK